MIRFYAGALMLVALTTASADAQANQAPTPSSSAALVGNWQGTIASPHGGDATMHLVIARDSTATGLTISIEYAGFADLPKAYGSEIKLEKNGIRWTHEIGPNSCTNLAVLVNGTLDGETSCGEVAIRFSLKKS